MTNDQWQGVCLLLVDIQNDFISGSLAVKDAETILPTVKRLIKDYPFQIIVSSQDFHPVGHISFASSHKDAEPFTIQKLPHPTKAKADDGQDIEQMMWPDHCIQGTEGCQFHQEVVEALKQKEAKGGRTFVVQKVSKIISNALQF
jgi:nicotinamidase/pyrazinamidase